MKWIKKGHIFRAEGQYDWMNSHTTPISAIELSGSIRIYFSTRSKQDKNGNYISNTGFIDVDKYEPSKILHISDKPLFELGEYGTFDEFGVMVTDVKKINNKIMLYYAGWQRLGGGTAAYQVMLGLGISSDNGYTFQKFSKGPIMGIDTFDTISIGNVAVLDDDGLFRLYYTSITEWSITGPKPSYEYIINYAVSSDGIHWKKLYQTAIGIEDGFGVATPTVLKINNIYHMWFGFRKKYDEGKNIGGYQIGYASSVDGVNWVRNDLLSGIGLSDSGWDSNMICYPSVIKVDNSLFMFYCGNGFGESGFGYAELEGDLI